MECFGCGGPHAWSKNFRGTYRVECLNANQPGVIDRAKLNIKDFQTCKKKRIKNFRKHKNVHTLNWEDIPPDRREVILQQQCSLMSVVTADGNNSIASSLTSPTLGPGSHPNVILHKNAIAVMMDLSKLPIRITIHSPTAHMTLQMGLCDKTKDCLGIQCVIGSGAVLNTANYHFMKALIQQNSHIIKKIYLPDNYAAIILSGIVSSPTDNSITTKLSVGFELYLLYHTKDGH
jgi:hypothetical protein